jgi:membrane associated rhomboid family serine protease
MTPVNLLLIAITAILSWMAFNNRKLADRLILWPPAVDRHRQYDRLITYGFIHADWSHLIFNMITLFFFGGFIESVMVQLTGSYLVYPAFYVGALLVSILPSYLKNQKNPNYLSLGASGAVSAVLFAFILIKPWSIILVFFIPAPAIVYAAFYVGYSIWMDKRGGDRINHSAHLAGAAFGVIFMLAMQPSIFSHFLRELATPTFRRGGGCGWPGSDPLYPTPGAAAPLRVRPGSADRRYRAGGRRLPRRCSGTPGLRSVPPRPVAAGPPAGRDRYRFGNRWGASRASTADRLVNCRKGHARLAHPCRGVSGRLA